jgi:hypothetical protein
LVPRLERELLVPRREGNESRSGTGTVTKVTKVRLEAVAYLPGTDGSNPSPSRRESTNFRFLARPLLAPGEFEISRHAARAKAPHPRSRSALRQVRFPRPWSHRSLGMRRFQVSRSAIQDRRRHWGCPSSPSDAAQIEFLSVQLNLARHVADGLGTPGAWEGRCIGRNG